MEIKSEISASKPKLMRIISYESKSWQSTNNERIIPELTLLCVLIDVVKIIPLRQSVSDDLKYKQTQR
jgi:hypothetical protein